MNEDSNYNANDEHRFDLSDGEPPEVETNSSSSDAVSVSVAVLGTMSKESDKKSRKNQNRSNNRNKDNNNRPIDDQFERDQYNRQSIMNIEDQFETSKLVLQLVTDSRFNMTQINGQRKLGGPPPGWKGPPPGPGCEIFVGKIPRTLYEHEIYPIFRKMGEVYEIRLMMDFSGTNRGYCFVMFGRPEFAQKAINELNDFEIRPGRKIGVVASINNCRLYVGQLPHDIPSEIVIKKIYDITDDVGQVSVYRNGNGQARYALIAYKTHRGAAMARRRLVPERASLFEGAEVSIDWAHPGMYPSNVVEDSGITDERGNIEMSRIVVGNENRRYQTRRKARDEFLDSSIKSYIESERALEHHRSTAAPRGRQQTSQKRAMDCYLNGGNSSGRTTTATSDSNKSSSSSAASARSSFDSTSRGNLKPGKGSGRTSTADVARKSSDSSFELTTTNNRGSCSSESSGSSSRSDRGIVDTAIKNLCFGSAEFYVDSENCDLEETKISKNVFNLFENYTFSKTAAAALAAAAAAAVDQANNDIFIPDHSTGPSNDSAKNIHSAHFSLGIDSSEPDEDKENLFSINESRSVVAPPKNYFLKNCSIETFPRATGTLPKVKPISSQKSSFSSHSKKSTKIAEQSHQIRWSEKAELHPILDDIENLNLHPSAIWQNHNDREIIVNRDYCWPLASNFENSSRGPNYENARSLLPSQNRSGTFPPVLFDKSNKTPKTETTMTFPNPNRILTQRNGCYNTPNFLNLNANTNARRAWIANHRELNGCDLPSDNAAGLTNFYKINPDFSGSGFIPAFQSQSQLQFLTSNDRYSNVNANGISARQNSANSIQGARFRPDVQNRRFSAGAGRNNGQRTGRPILSRSHASFCNEN